MLVESGLGVLKANSNRLPSAGIIPNGVDKGLVEHKQLGTKYIYRAVRSRHSASRNAVKHLLSTFFQGSVSEAVNMMIDIQSNKLTSEELNRLESIIEQARKEGK